MTQRQVEDSTNDSSYEAAERTESGTISGIRSGSGSSFGPSIFRPVLIGIAGPSRGTHIPLTKLTTVIGRGGNADFRISDTGCSRAHARITYENHDRANMVPKCLIEDLGSRNGTEINGRRISNQSVRLQERDRITIGRTVLGYFLRDEAELRHEESLYESATRDSLTGLDNRRQLLALLRSHLARAQRSKVPLSFLLIDADHFKRINDTYGHDCGDEALKFLSRILRVTCRDSDLVARWGGEEFAVALPDTRLDDANRLAERVRATLASSDLVLGNKTIRITASIGVSEFTSGDTIDTLFRRADEQLYRAKDLGRNRVCSVDANGLQIESGEGLSEERS